MPPASSTCACDFALAGIAGLCWMFARNDDGQRRDHERAGERRAQRGAEVRHRVLDAADLGALVVRHRRDRDGAELRGERPDAEPDRAASARRRSPARRPASSAGEQDDRPGEQREQAEADDEARRDCREAAAGCRSPPPAASPRAAAAGRRSRAPRGRGRPRGRAARRRRSPPGRGTGRRTSSGRRSAACCAASPCRTSGSWPCDSRRASQRKKTQITKRPPRISQIVGRQPGP